MLDVDATSRVRAGRRRALFDPSEVIEVDHDRTEIERVLPHRGSMLLLDRVTRMDLVAQRAAGRRWIDPDDPILIGHFPGDPLYPGVLQVEMAGQLGLYIALRSQGAGGEPPHPRLDVRLVRVLEVSFPAALRPGVEVDVLAEVLVDDGYVLTCVGQLIHEGVVICVGAFEAMIMERES